MYFDDLSLGMTREIVPTPIQEDEMLAFAKRYDHIPLHIDKEYAQKTCFGDIIAPGVMSFMAIWANYLNVDFFGEELLAGKSSKIEWCAPVYAGDVLYATATVTALTPRGERNGVVEISITAQNQKGVTVLTNVTEAIVKRRPKSE